MYHALRALKIADRIVKGKIPRIFIETASEEWNDFMRLRTGTVSREKEQHVISLKKRGERDMREAVGRRKKERKRCI